jgi:hypothetical protein
VRGGNHAYRTSWHFNIGNRNQPVPHLPPCLGDASHFVGAKRAWAAAAQNKLLADGDDCFVVLCKAARRATGRAGCSQNDILPIESPMHYIV